MKKPSIFDIYEVPEAPVILPTAVRKKNTGAVVLPTAPVASSPATPTKTRIPTAQVNLPIYQPGENHLTAPKRTVTPRVLPTASTRSVSLPTAGPALPSALSTFQPGRNHLTLPDVTPAQIRPYAMPLRTDVDQKRVQDTVNRVTGTIPAASLPAADRAALERAGFDFTADANLTPAQIIRKYSVLAVLPGISADTRSELAAQGRRALSQFAKEQNRWSVFDYLKPRRDEATSEEQQAAAELAERLFGQTKAGAGMTAAANAMSFGTIKNFPLGEDIKGVSGLTRRETVEQAEAMQPGAAAVGSTAGEIAKMLATGGIIGDAVQGIPIVQKVPALGRILSSGLTFGAVSGLNTAGAGGTLGESLKNAGIGFAGGAAGGAASEAVGGLVGAGLSKIGLQNSIPAAVVERGLQGAGFAAGNTGATYFLLPENSRPTKEQIVQDAAVAGLYASIMGLIEIPGMVRADRARLERGVQTMRGDFEKYSYALSGAASDAERAAMLDSIIQNNRQLGEALKSGRFLGQQETVNQIRLALDQMNGVLGEMKAGLYVTPLLPAGTAGGTAPSPLAPMLPTAGGAPLPGGASAFEAPKPEPTQTPVIPLPPPVQTGAAVWHSAEADQPVEVTGYAGSDGGKRYVTIAGSDTAIPQDQITYLPTADSAGDKPGVAYGREAGYNQVGGDFNANDARGTAGRYHQNDRELARAGGQRTLSEETGGTAGRRTFAEPAGTFLARTAQDGIENGRAGENPERLAPVPQFSGRYGEARNGRAAAGALGGLRKIQRSVYEFSGDGGDQTRTGGAAPRGGEGPFPTPKLKRYSDAAPMPPTEDGRAASLGDMASVGNHASGYNQDGGEIGVRAGENQPRDAFLRGMEVNGQMPGIRTDAGGAGGHTRIETKSKGKAFEFEQPAATDLTELQRNVRAAGIEDGLDVVFAKDGIVQIEHGEEKQLSANGIYLGNGRIILTGNGESYRHEKFHYLDEIMPEETKTFCERLRSLANLSDPDVVQYLDAQIAKYREYFPNFRDVDIWNEIAAATYNAPEQLDGFYVDQNVVLQSVRQLDDAFQKRRTGSHRTPLSEARYSIAPRGGEGPFPKPKLKWYSDAKPQDGSGYGPHSIGATEGGSRPTIEELIDEYGTLRKGEQPRAREMELPKETREGRVSRFAQNAAESAAVDEGTVDELKREIENGTFAYVPIGDKAAVSYANSRLEQVGTAAAAAQFDALVNSGKRLGKNEIALGERLIQEAAASGDYDTAVRLIADVATMGSEMGQAVQALRILKRLTPEGNLRALDTVVNRINSRQAAKGKTPVHIPRENAADILSQTTREGLADANARAIKAVAEQMPATWVDKWNAWRYLSMLANPSTHIRNILGNAVFVPARKLKNLIAAGMEHTVVLPGGAKTKAVLTPRDKVLVEFAKADYEKPEVKNAAMESGKMNPADMIRDERTIFNTKWLESGRKGNTAALDLEDKFFSKGAYADALAQVMKARGLSPEFLQSGTKSANAALEEARKIAIQEARRATYRDASKVADALNRFSRTNAVTALLTESVLPFKKTPINILKRGVEYSPIGLVKGITYDLWRVKSNRITATEAIDNIAAGLSGTVIMALGAWLAHLGLLTGGGSDDRKENSFDRLQGGQTYALKIDDKTYTIDWMAPVSLPLFVGAEAYNMAKSDDPEMTFIQFLDAASRITEPMLNLSMLDGLNSSIRAVAGSESPIADFVLNAAGNYVGQAVPTVLGKVARSIDGTRRNSYYVDKNSPLPKFLQLPAQKMMAKIPGVSMLLPPSVDQWGRESEQKSPVLRTVENFLSPGYLATARTTPADQAVAELYEATGDKSVLPGYAQKYFSVDGKKVNLTTKQYTEYSKVRGQTANQLVGAMVENPIYGGLTNEDKIKALQNVYAYANAVGKAAVSDYVPDGWISKAQKAAASGISVDTYILIRDIYESIEADTDEYGNSISGTAKAKRVAEIAAALGETEQRAGDIYDELFVRKHSMDELGSAARRAYELGLATKNMRPEDYLKYTNVMNTTEGGKEEKIEALMENGLDEKHAEYVYAATHSFVYRIEDLSAKDQEKYEQELKPHNMGEWQFLELRNALSQITGTKGANGKTISGSQKRNRYQYLIQQGMAPKEARYLLTVMYDYKW